MSTKIYNGLISRDVRSIKQLATLKNNIRKLQEETIKDACIHDFNQFFKDFLYTLVENKGYVSVKTLFTYIRFQEGAFPGIRENLLGTKSDNYYDMLDTMERYFDDEKINSKFLKLKEGESFPKVISWIYDSYGINLQDDTYESDLLAIYIILYHLYTGFKRYYDNRFGQNTIAYNMYLYPLTNGKLLGYAVDTDMYKKMISSGLMEEYHYQNQSDEPDDVSEHDWAIREHDWGKAIKHQINEGLCIEPDFTDVSVTYFRISENNIDFIYQNFKDNVTFYTEIKEKDYKNILDGEFNASMYQGPVRSPMRIINKFNDFYKNNIPDSTKNHLKNVIEEGIINIK